MGVVSVQKQYIWQQKHHNHQICKSWVSCPSTFIWFKVLGLGQRCNGCTLERPLCGQSALKAARTLQDWFGFFTSRVASLFFRSIVFHQSNLESLARNYLLSRIHCHLLLCTVRVKTWECVTKDMSLITSQQFFYGGTKSTSFFRGTIHYSE